jgi:hypothetical protein
METLCAVAVYAAYRVKYEGLDPEQALAVIPEKKLWPLSLQQLPGITLGVHRKLQTKSTG